MAREINWDEPLSDEDRAWAEQRPDAPAGNGMTVAQRLAQIDDSYGNPKTAREREKRIEQLRGEIDSRTIELERLQREAEEEGNPNVAVTGDPAQGLIRDNTGVDGETPEGAPTGKQTYNDEKYWTVSKLQDEIRSRNIDRQAAGLTPLATSGKRSELVERLLKDDEELEQETDE